MAIYKPTMTMFGVEAEYWKITSLLLVENRTQIYAEVTLSGYLDPEASVTSEPLSQISYVWRGEDYPFRSPVDTDFKTVAYNKIKLEEAFIDGTDV